jgi:hypothetical protein
VDAKTVKSELLKIIEVLEQISDQDEAELRLLGRLTTEVIKTTDQPLALATSKRLSQPFRPDKSCRPEIIIATNRVAMWRFFERYVCPAAIASGNHTYKNPFTQSSKLFTVVMDGWRPVIATEAKKYCAKTENGWQMMDDIMSIATGALLEALERQAMDIISMAKKGQLIPFHLKLRYAIQRHMHQNLPDLIGGGIRIGFDARAFHEERPVFLSFEDYMHASENEDPDQ